MRKPVIVILILTILLLAFGLISLDAQALIEGYVVETYSLDDMGIEVISNAFGLAFNGTHLIGHSTPIYHNPETPYYFIDPADMSVYGPFLGPDRFDTAHPGQPGNTRDLAYGNGSIWATFGGTYDALIWRFEPWTGTILDSMYCPRWTGAVDSCSPTGLAYDGYYLWLAEIKPNNPQQIIYKIDPNDKSIVDQFDYFYSWFDDRVHGLAYGDGYLWIAGSNEIYKVDPSTHGIVNAFPNPANNTYYEPGFANLAFDGMYLWAADDNSLYKIATQAALSELVITSLPVVGISFVINGTVQTTPYSDSLLEGSYNVEMPETYDVYVWSHWLEDGDPNRTKTIALPGSTWTGVYVFAVLPYGPTADFTVMPETANVGESVKFDASSSQPGWNGTDEMPIAEYRWNFADGNQTTTSTPIVYHKFGSSGIYYVTLTVFSPGATPETDSASHKVTIISVPVGGYSILRETRSTAKSLTPYMALISIIAIAFTVVKRKTIRETR